MKDLIPFVGIAAFVILIVWAIRRSKRGSTEEKARDVPGATVKTHTARQGHAPGAWVRLQPQYAQLSGVLLRAWLGP